jgi:polyhydroxyalkanoate synthesis regulator protein
VAQHLKACVAMERAIFYLEQVKKWYESGRLTIPIVEIIEILIPCILHCENRVGEKIITIILRRQLDKFSGQKMDFIDAMDETFQTKVLGSVTSPSHWRLKHSKDSDGQLKLESLQVRNQTVRKMLDSIDIIVEDAAGESDDEFKTKMIFAVASFKEAMKILTTHRSLTEEEMERFQDKIDDFYEAWIDLFGEEGITNYIHLLGSGHMLYFLKKYGCLYIYSQQGWEDLNNRCQAYLLHNTSRGGYGSGQGKGKSYTFPIVRFILRDLLWKTGDADIYFNTLE